MSSSEAIMTLVRSSYDARNSIQFVSDANDGITQKLTPITTNTCIALFTFGHDDTQKIDPVPMFKNAN